MQNTSIILLMKQINRLKIVLAEQNKTGKWLAETLERDEATISRWCTITNLNLLLRHCQRLPMH